MAQYPHLKYPMQTVRKAGQKLAGKLYLHDNGDYTEANDVFRIANSWRDSHFLPMRSAYLSLRFKMLRNGLAGDVAARPKRMSSIRRKLRESSTKLDQMQDIAGVRAIMDDIAGVRALTASIQQKFPHTLRQEWAYIDAPKEDGYRSHHLVFHFCPGKKDQEPFTGRRIELQIRTRLQHSWATAVEAVGLFNGVDLKHHKGSEDWLRLFQLMSAEFSHVEGCPVGPGVPSRRERIEEIKGLNDRLGAANVLQNIRSATHYAETFVYERGKFFLIVYKPDHTVEVENFDDSIQVTSRLAMYERQIEDGVSASKAVVVEVDKVENLVRTYPNYFGDVSLFLNNLLRITKGQDAREYSLSPQQVVRPRPQEMPDPRLLVRRYTRWGRE
ncbi:hypothetical protein FHT87_002427 [Rhizobium sp. BK316]|uniref:RelA/SpoT domain-containing protein n=1 Tax=Rhizobium sp. BK316 TaxID=2587053 RepID=UPI001615A9F3|nr:RelA/SpoT domain-containing protein [Rhizobium sp. BK316]MBB3408524.1 hypothetical protein [Rhizobium sp. BK316]